MKCRKSLTYFIPEPYLNLTMEKDIQLINKPQRLNVNTENQLHIIWYLTDVPVHNFNTNVYIH
jgi:hypothetical protein